MKEQDQSHGSLTYPARGTLNRFLYKLPLWLWRMGFGGYLSSPARGGSKMLVITTMGRTSKLPRHTMLSYTIFDDREYVASGWGERSDWVKNFLADPLVTIQARGRIYAAYAKRVQDPGEFAGVAKSLLDSGGDSHFDEWLDGLGVKPNLDDFLANQDRFYFVGFNRAREEGPAPLTANLLWIWAVVFSLLFFLLFYFL